MNITVYSRNRLYETFTKWDVPRDFADPMANYLVYGYGPGGFFTSVLANDFHGAISRSHPNKTIEALKSLGGWITDCMPPESFGGYQAVSDWCYMKPEHRRSILERCGLIYTEQEEIMMALREESTIEPILYLEVK
jgi:hypothetical protein